jgi:hypothetical protein
VNRQVLASEALLLSRSILQQIPVSVRIASLVHGFLLQAFTRDDMHLAIGLHALIAMEKAGTVGDIEGSTIEELRPWIKRNVLSKLKPYALAIGGKIYNTSMAGRQKISLPLVEEAWESTTQLLERHPLASDKQVGQVISFIANGFTMRIKDVLKAKKRHDEIHKDEGVADKLHGREKGINDIALWKEVERRFKSDPDLLGPKGEPWAWIYIESRAADMSETEIAELWNEASRRSGGEGGMNRASLIRWREKRLPLMRQLIKGYLDDETVKRLKLAVARGALETTLLQPFQRELLQLLAA